MNRVYGVLGIKAIMANWNADFSGRPKSTANGTIFGSDKALKYPIKRYMMLKGEKVLFAKSWKIGKDDKLQPKELLERYEELFDKLEEKTSSTEVLSNLFKAMDVMCFGATFAAKKQNISITGAIQIGQGFNVKENTEVIPQDILSPFRNSNKDEANQASLGTKIVADEAHYFYPFAVNPSNYDEYLNLGIKDFNGFTREAYELFKEGALKGATSFNTNSKTGAENEFGIFIELKENSKLYLPNLDSYLGFIKEDKNIIDFSKLSMLLKNYENEIEKIEIYYNNINTDIKNVDFKAELKPLIW